MTRTASESRRTLDSRLPGARLLGFARLICAEPVIRTVVSPALADLQAEVRDAGTSRTKRRQALVRGYLAFWKLLLLLSLTPAGSSAGGPITSLLLGGSGGNAVAVLVATLFAAIWPMFGWFVAGTLAGGLLLAVVLRRWHNRHPSLLAPDHPLASLPAAEINLSSIPIAGDIGGLFFVVGSFVIVLLGLPHLRWFVLGAMAAGGALGGGLLAWRSAHWSAPAAGNSILRR